MSGQYRIVFKMPGRGDEKFYYRRDSEVSPDVTQAHAFHSADSVIAFRDRFRDEYKQCAVYIEDSQGNRLFERDTQPQSETRDNRSPVWFSPDDLESHRLGYIVRPGIRPDMGRCWYIRSSDFPNLVGRDIESVFGNTPLEAVERCRALWGALAQPIPHPLGKQLDTVAAKKILQQIEKIKQGPGRRRPGND
jgi:hypothetical protein